MSWPSLLLLVRYARHEDDDLPRAELDCRALLVHDEEVRIGRCVCDTRRCVRAGLWNTQCHTTDTGHASARRLCHGDCTTTDTNNITTPPPPPPPGTKHVPRMRHEHTGNNTHRNHNARPPPHQLRGESPAQPSPAQRTHAPVGTTRWTRHRGANETESSESWGPQIPPSHP